jgi:hypothetical protein
MPTSEGSLFRVIVMQRSLETILTEFKLGNIQKRCKDLVSMNQVQVSG